MFTDLSQTQTLQALLLSLKELDILSSQEKEKLRNISERLEENYEWETGVKPEVFDFINGAGAIKKHFVEAIQQLNQMADEEISHLFPTVNDLEKVIPAQSSDQQKREVQIPTEPADKDGNSVSNMVIDDNHISNMAMIVLATENPVKTARNLLGRKKNDGNYNSKKTVGCE
ncbi:MAG: hypothetical protein WBA13_19350 [Microcoleaceae cyanobacterium]